MSLKKPDLDCGSHATVRSVRQTVRLLLLRSIAQLSVRPLSMRGLSSPSVPRSVLLVRPDHLGDVLFTAPAVRHLRRMWPTTRLTMLTGPWAKPIAERIPFLDEVLTCPFPWFSRQPRKSFLEPYLLLRREAERIGGYDFDLSIVMRFDHWWGAWLSLWAGIPCRVGYDTPEVAPFLTRPVPYTTGCHEVLQNLALAKAATGCYRPSSIPPTRGEVCHSERSEESRLEFQPTEDEVESADRLLTTAGIRPKDRLVCVHPGAGAPVKLWGNEAWARVIQALVQEYGVKVILSGGPGEVELARDLESALAPHVTLNHSVGRVSIPDTGSCSVTNLAGRTNLGQLAAVMQRCHLVMGVDSGPLHLAVAAGAPTVHLFGPVDARLFGPWGDPQRHLVVTSGRDCIPCNRLDYATDELDAHPCVREIPVDAVLSAARRLLDSAWRG